MAIPAGPTLDAAPSLGAAPSSNPPSQTAPPLNVLVVDDNPIDRLQASWLVGLDTRCHVIHAENGVQALELMANQEVATVLTDLKMEQMDGLALVRAVRKEYPHVPVILMTAHGSEDVAMEALRVGATDYVSKTKLTQELHGILARALRTAAAGHRRRRCLHALIRRESLFELSNDPDVLPPFLEFLQDDLSKLDRWDPTEVMRVTIAVDEAIRNAMYHGNLELTAAQKVLNRGGLVDLARERSKEHPYRGRRIEILIVHEPERSRFVIRDDGAGFDTSDANRPVDPDDMLQSSGRGLLLMKSFMDSVSFNSTGNQVTLVRERSTSSLLHHEDAVSELTRSPSQRLLDRPDLRSDPPVVLVPAQASAGSKTPVRSHLLSRLPYANGLSETLEEDFYKRLLDSLYDGVYFVDTKRRILYWNEAAEALTGYSRSEVIGRPCFDGLLEHLDHKGCILCFHDCPLHVSMKREIPVEDRVMLRHKDGRRISVNVRIMPVRDAQGKVIGGVEIFRDATQELVVENAFRQVREVADRDPLTGIANRRYLDRMLARYLERVDQPEHPLSVIMSDLDHFKQINDTWGHGVGDQALIGFATMLQNQCRQQDLVARIGGEEYLVLLPGHTRETASSIAERLRRKTAEATPPGLGNRVLTASFGVAQAQPGESAADLLRRADVALYQAKTNGRNRVEVAVT